MHTPALQAERLAYDSYK